MSGQTPGRISLPQTRSFGPNESALDVDETPPGLAPHEALGSPRRGAHVLFTPTRHRSSLPGSRMKDVGDGEGGFDAAALLAERPAIPSALQPAEAYTTPLPLLSMVVLSITMLGEFLSANVSTPFVLDMVKSFGEISDESEIAAWTGLLVSTFFLTQFLTSLLWATVADKYGQRAVLFTSLLGSAITCSLFGTSTSLREAMAIRLLQGIFAGAIGVARGCVTFVTDPSNEGRAYAILGFCWGFGGVAGAIIGGSFESPAKKWPGAFGHVPLFVNYPYLLPALIASAITTTGALLSLFLAPDGGPRTGAIQLPEKTAGSEHPSTIMEEDESAPSSPIMQTPRSPGPFGSLRRKLSKQLSGVFHKGGQADTSPPAAAEQAVPMSLSVAIPRARSTSRNTGRNVPAPSAAEGAGSAYGYGSAYRHRLASTATMRRGSLAGSLAAMRRRGSTVAELRGASVGAVEGGELNFAQRLLMANENAVTNIADLWVAAAMNVDNEDVFESDTDEEAAGAVHDSPTDAEEAADEFDFGSPAGELPEEPLASSSVPGTPDRRGRDLLSPGKKRSHGQGLVLGFKGAGVSPRRPSTSTMRFAGRRMSTQSGAPSHSQLSDETVTGAAARRPSSAVPTIFSNPGLKTPPALGERHAPMQPLGTPDAGHDGLAPIVESRPVSMAMARSPLREPRELEAQSEKVPSMASQLPLAIIAQYGMLALHSTTHDQIFLSYLVSEYKIGGLNLNPAHFAQIIALMSLAQIVFQFYLYPNIGPPRGRFSHLAMFRIGSALFLPSYITVTLYRTMASPDSEGNLLVMTGLTLSTAVRFCGNTFAYTSVSILLNYMSPPHIVGYANGIAQSMVSLARFIGPILGGYLWSVSIHDNPSGYPLGFFVCAAACALAIVHTFFIR